MPNRVLRALKRQGPIGFARLCLANAWLVLSGNAARHDFIHDNSWDKTHGVDTAGTVEIDELTVADHERLGAVRYEPTPPDCFSYLLEASSLESTDGYMFIDVGSGKGRVLLLAAQAGFKRVVGIELGPELHALACRNIAAMKRTHAIGDVSSVRADATSYEFPPAPTVCFLNNPFGPEVLDRLLDNIEASLSRTPRPFTIIYYHSNHAGRLSRRPGWSPVREGNWRDESHHYSIFRWREEPKRQP